MKAALIWLMMVGVSIGTLAGLLPHISDKTDTCVLPVGCNNHESYYCEEPTQHDNDCDAEHGERSEGTKSASHHHHHHLHVCCGAAPVLYAEGDTLVGMISLNGTRMCVPVENMVEPESPVFELDKPPLI